GEDAVEEPGGDEHRDHRGEDDAEGQEGDRLDHDGDEAGGPGLGGGLAEQREEGGAGGEAEDEEERQGLDGGRAAAAGPRGRALGGGAAFGDVVTHSAILRHRGPFSAIPRPWRTGRE